MVSPIYLIAVALGGAFLLPFFEKLGKNISKGVVLLITTFFVLLPLYWYLGGSLEQPLIVQTAGFSAPFSINLMVGVGEALFMIAINAAAWLGCLYFILKKELEWNSTAQVLFLTLLMGTNGLIMTRDLFNIFVFLEITSISMYALIALIRSKQSYEAGFKYMIAGGIASALFLIGVIYIYRFTGTLNLDSMLAESSALNGIQGLTALFLLLSALLIELKPFPANGWGADAYEASEPGISAMATAISATGVFFVLYKITPLLPPSLMEILIISGVATFFFAQLVAIKQKRIRRMLGYSSIGQIGLLIAVAGFFGPDSPEGFMILAILAVNHLFSKAGLFWISGIFSNENLDDGVNIRKQPVVIAVFGILIAALAGLPPFPAFWAKWMLIISLGQSISYFIMAVILVGSLLEAFYLFRWFLGLVKSEKDPGNIHEEIIPEDDAEVKIAVPELIDTSSIKTGAAFIAPLLSALILSVLGIFIGKDFLVSGSEDWLQNLFLLIPIAGIVLFSIFDLIKLPVKLQVFLGIAVLAAYGWILYPMIDGIRFVFAVIFIAGSLVQLFSLTLRKGRHPGLMAFLMGMILSLGNLLVFNTAIGFFFSWEVMTVTSFLLISRGKNSSGAALRYIIFSLSGAFIILAALAISPASGSFYDILPGFAASPVISILFGLGFLIKLGAFGFHIWLPGAYAEADDEISSFLSSVLSKAGLFMLFITAGLYTGNSFSGVTAFDFAVILGWIGALTALSGAFLALFQEDIKYTLAYSSMGQIGYMLLSFALMTQLGWMNSLYLAVTHLMFKGMLFLAIAGVMYRTKTRMMYQMGGLISRMPVSFFTVLIAIIALSGVPPLTGFGAKWMLYTALIEKGWLLQAGVAMFASGVAFLYLFRLIHVIFLGQLKDIHREVKEAPLGVLIPQIVFIIGIMAFSMYPNLILKPLQSVVMAYFPSGIEWDGYTVLSSLGYWNGNAVMFVTMGIFMILFIWLIIVQSNPQKVKQFNIVFASERPDRPETTHFGFNFFAPYKKALGFMLIPRVISFWNVFSSTIDVTASSVRRLYTGNGQTYGIQILLYLSIMILIVRGGI